MKDRCNESAPSGLLLTRRRSVAVLRAKTTDPSGAGQIVSIEQPTAGSGALNASNPKPVQGALSASHQAAQTDVFWPFETADTAKIANGLVDHGAGGEAAIT